MDEFEIKVTATDLALIQSALVTPQIRAVVDLSNRLETQARAQVDAAQAAASGAGAPAETPSA